MYITFRRLFGSVRKSGKREVDGQMRERVI